VKLLANENFPKASVLLLRNLGYDVASIGEDIPQCNKMSKEQMQRPSNSVVVTTHHNGPH